MSEDGFSDLYDEPSMDLFIETLTGTTFEMRVYPSDTILDIKKKIQRVEGIPIHHQNLLFRLEEVDDYKRLCDIGIVNGSTLKLVLSMRGGPISTRRLSSCDHHLIWKDLKDLIEHTREELGDKLTAGAKVSVLVFKDGDVINLIRVIENDDGSYHPYGDKPSSTRFREDGQGVYNKIQEQNSMLAKLSELKKKMADVSLKRHFKNSQPAEEEKKPPVGCIGDKPPKENDEEDAKEDKATDSNRRYHLLDQFRKDAVSLLKLHESQFCDDDEEDDENDSDDLEEALQICEDSIALKEKHRGKNSFYNLLFQDPSFHEKPAKTPRKYFGTEIPISTTFSKEARERGNFHVRPSETALKTKLKEKPSEHNENPPGTDPSPEVEEKLVGKSVLSPLYNCFAAGNHSRAHNYENKINLPDITCDLDISPPTTASSLAESLAIIDEDTENEDKEVLSPIGVPCAGTLSMSKVPTRNSVRLTPLLLQNDSDRPKSNPETVNIDENAQEICDIFTGDSATGKLGLLKRWQSVDCSSNEICNSAPPRNFKQTRDSDVEVVNQNCRLPSLFSANSAPKSDCIGDLYFGNRLNQDRISRSPLYRRYSQSGGFPEMRSSEGHRKFDGKLPSISSKWGPPGSSGSQEKSKCDINLQPVSGASVYNFINARSPLDGLSENRLNPLRLKNEHKSKHLASEIKNLNLCTGDGDGNGINKIEVDAAKLKNLPAIIEKKRMRCSFCNKKLNLTNMYDCRCGGIFCGQHRYSEVHYCNYDYKTEGRKLLEQQNPVIVADKLNKL